MRRAFILVIFLSLSAGATGGIISDSLGIDRDDFFSTSPRIRDTYKVEKGTRGIEIEDLFQSPLVYISGWARNFFLSRISLGEERTDEERIVKVRFGVRAFKDTAIVYDKEKKAFLVLEKSVENFYCRRYWAAVVKRQGDKDEWLHYVYERSPNEYDPERDVAMRKLTKREYEKMGGIKGGNWEKDMLYLVDIGFNTGNFRDLYRKGEWVWDPDKSLFGIIQDGHFFGVEGCYYWAETKEVVYGRKDSPYKTYGETEVYHFVVRFQDGVKKDKPYLTGFKVVIPEEKDCMKTGIRKGKNGKAIGYGAMFDIGDDKNYVEEVLRAAGGEVDRRIKIEGYRVGVIGICENIARKGKSVIDFRFAK